jgi:hypothetical protein
VGRFSAINLVNFNWQKVSKSADKLENPSGGFWGTLAVTKRTIKARFLTTE